MNDITFEQAWNYGGPLMWVLAFFSIWALALMIYLWYSQCAGIVVPDAVVDELKADKEKTKAGIAGVEIAARIIRECRPYCQGVHIMALGWEARVPEVLRLAGI